MLRDHDPEDYITQLVDVPFDPEAKAPTWGAFLKDIFLGNQSVIDYVQRAIGYSLTGSTAEQCIFYEHGAGDNGKSTLIEAIGGVIGEDYMIPVDKEAVLHADKNKGRGATPELVQLRGKRLGYISENDDDRVLDEGRIKALSGSGKTNARDLYRKQRRLRRTHQDLVRPEHAARSSMAWTTASRAGRRSSRSTGGSRPIARTGSSPRSCQAEAKGILAWIVAGCGRLEPGRARGAARGGVRHAGVCRRAEPPAGVLPRLLRARPGGPGHGVDPPAGLQRLVRRPRRAAVRLPA